MVFEENFIEQNSNSVRMNNVDHIASLEKGLFLFM